MNFLTEPTSYCRPTRSLSTGEGYSNNPQRVSLMSLKKAVRDIPPINRQSASKLEKIDISKLTTIDVIRVETIIELRKIYNCLSSVFNINDKKIILTEHGLSVAQVENISFNAESNKASVKFIYQKILRAMTSHIEYFFDDRGNLVTIKEIDDLARKKIGEHQTALQTEMENEILFCYEKRVISPFEADIQDEFDYRRVISNLQFPKIADDQNLTENEKLSIAIFQKLYPLEVREDGDEKVPLLAPITYLCSYKNFVTTKELFKQALLVLRLPKTEMPYMQRLRVLNFIRLALQSLIIEDQEFTKNIKETIREIILLQVFEKQEFTDLCHEIQYLLEKNKSDSLSEKFRISFKPTYQVENFLSGDTAIPDYTQFLDALTDDIKYLSGQSFLNTSLDSLLTDKESKNENFYANIMNYIITHFIKNFEIKPEEMTNKNLIKNKLNNLFEIYIDVAYELVKKHDYLSSFSIYNVFNKFVFSKLIESLFDRTNGSTCTKIPAQKNFKRIELEELFSTNRNFEQLRKKMKACQELHISYIPFIGPIKNSILHNIELIENKFNHEKINYLKFQMIAEENWRTNQFLQDVMVHFKDQKISMQTNIGYALLVDNRYSEDKLDEIYANLIGVLNPPHILTLKSS